MTSKPETTFIRNIHRHLSESYFEKMNNPFRGGTADVWYSGSEGDLWVEYKYEPRLPRSRQYIPRLSPIQVKWMEDRFFEGRPVAVILGVPEGGIIFTDLQWRVPASRTELLQRVVSRPAIAQWIFSRVGRSPCRTSSGASQTPPR